MIKKNFRAIFILCIFIWSCNGSSTYQGKWKAVDEIGKRMEFDFSPKSISITDSSNKTSTHHYKQYSVRIENSKREYTIKLSDGRHYEIFFPYDNNINEGVISINHEPIYSISRTRYIPFDSIKTINYLPHD